MLARNKEVFKKKQIEANSHLNQYGYNHEQFSNRIEKIQASAEANAKRILDAQKSDKKTSFSENFRNAVLHKVFKTCNLNCTPIYKHDLRIKVAEYIKQDI